MEARDFDFLVNNGGIGIYAPFAETTEKQFDELISIQLKRERSSLVPRTR